MANVVCYLFVSFAEAAILWQYTSTLFILKHSVKDRIAVLSGTYFLLFIVSLFNYSGLNAALFLAANFIFLSTQCRIRWYFALFHSAIITAVMGMCELMVTGIILLFSPNFLMTSRRFFELAVLSIFSKTLYFSIIYIIIHFLKRSQKCDLHQDKSVFLLGFISLNSIFVMLTLIRVVQITAYSSSLDWMVIISAVLLLISNLLVFGINQQNQQKNMEFTQMQMLLQKESNFAEYYKMLASQKKNQNILIHDIKNHLYSIDLLNGKRAHDEISSYIHHLMLSYKLAEVVQFCNHDMLNAILCRYKRKCDELHISLYPDIRDGATRFISDSDLTALFCNLLDNALTAADGIKDAVIEITASKKENTPFVVIAVTNPCKSNPFSRRNSELITHKSDKDRHGYGLKSIRKVIDSYDGKIEMYYDEDTLTFHSIIMIKDIKHDEVLKCPDESSPSSSTHIPAEK